jgi:hypothetical protein
MTNRAQTADERVAEIKAQQRKAYADVVAMHILAAAIPGAAGLSGPNAARLVQAASTVADALALVRFP